MVSKRKYNWNITIAKIKLELFSQMQCNILKYQKNCDSFPEKVITNENFETYLSINTNNKRTY